LWSVSRLYPSLCPEGIKRAMKTVSQINRTLSRDLNLGPTGVPTVQQRRQVPFVTKPEGSRPSGLLSFWTLSIVWYSKKHITFRKFGSVFVLRCREEGHLLSWVRLKELTSITGQCTPKVAL
jgi:hypothetical protein